VVLKIHGSLPEQFRRGLTMEPNKHLIPEERARITKIQDLLIERYVEQKEALDEGNRCRALELEFEIKELLHEKRASSVGSCLTGLGDEIRHADRPVPALQNAMELMCNRPAFVDRRHY
jgi:hypothetical protein